MLEEDDRCMYTSSIQDKSYNAIEELFEVYKMINYMIREYNPSMEYDVRKYYPDVFSSIREIRRGRMFETIEQNLMKGKREGYYRKEMNTRTIAQLHMFRIESLMENDMFSSAELSSFSLFHELFVYHLYGILTNKGRKFFETNFEQFKATLD